jgi:iron complex transport system ATP-binding protein
VLRDVTLSVEPGDFLALAGPNGSGKTTLLKLLSGIARPTRGRIDLASMDLRAYSARARARRIAVVSQHVNPALAFSVRHLVSLGRTAHVSTFGTLSRRDREAVERALIATETQQLAPRRFAELSGGERQRVALATALAQETDFLLLDEPTVHMDLHHQRELLETLLRQRQERGVAVVAVMHDLNLAALYFDRLVLLHEGHMVLDGPPGQVIGSSEFGRVFEAPFSVIAHPQTGAPQVMLHRDG